MKSVLGKELPQPLLASIELPILMMRVLQFVRFGRALLCVKSACLEVACLEISCGESVCVDLAEVFFVELACVEFVWLDFAPHEFLSDLRAFLDSIRD